MVSIAVNSLCAIVHLRILARHLDFIELAVLKVRKIVAQHFERLRARAPIKELLVSVAPSLQLLDVVRQRRLYFQEVVLVLLLIQGVRCVCAASYTTHLGRPVEVGRQTNQLMLRCQRNRPIIIWVAQTIDVLLSNVSDETTNEKQMSSTCTASWSSMQTSR